MTEDINFADIYFFNLKHVFIIFTSCKLNVEYNEYSL